MWVVQKVSMPHKVERIYKLSKYWSKLSFLCIWTWFGMKFYWNIASLWQNRHFFHILRTARGFWKYCKKRGGGRFLALKSHIICSSKKSCMKTKVDIVCFTVNSVFLIDPKNDDCTEEKMRTDFFSFLFLWSPIFSSSFSPFSLFFSSPLYHASFTPSHLGYAHLI